VTAVHIRYWILLHVVGAFLFVGAHGVSMFVALRIRKETDPKRVGALLELSTGALWAFYGSLLILLTGGIVAGFMLSSWSQGWIWTALAILLFTIVFMYAVATPYYKKVRTVTEALQRGSQAVTPDQYRELLRSRRPHVLAVEGMAALLVIVWLMILKPF
jgi:uncharacterized membrane protein